jgi:hypothetical protein
MKLGVLCGLKPNCSMKPFSLADTLGISCGAALSTTSSGAISLPDHKATNKTLLPMPFPECKRNFEIAIPMTISISSNN